MIKLSLCSPAQMCSNCLSASRRKISAVRFLWGTLDKRFVKGRYWKRTVLVIVYSVSPRPFCRTMPFSGLSRCVVWLNCGIFLCVLSRKKGLRTDAWNRKQWYHEKTRWYITVSTPIRPAVQLRCLKRTGSGMCGKIKAVKSIKAFLHYTSLHKCILYTNDLINNS